VLPFGVLIERIGLTVRVLVRWLKSDSKYCLCWLRFDAPSAAAEDGGGPSDFD
jgi:hypothetical protein